MLSDLMLFLKEKKIQILHFKSVNKRDNWGRELDFIISFIGFEVFLEPRSQAPTPTI